MVDASEAVVFKHPRTGEVVSVEKAPLYALLFGFFYFALQKLWKHAVAGALLLLPTLGFSWLIYTLYARSILRQRLLAGGWEPLSGEDGDDVGYRFLILLIASIWVAVVVGLIAYGSMIYYCGGIC